MNNVERLSTLDQTAENGPKVLQFTNDLGSISLVGECLGMPADFAQRAQVALDSKRLQLDQMQSLPGSYSIVAERRDECRVNIEPSGQFPLFWRNDGGELHLATDARSLTRGEINAQYLAASILRCPELTHTQSVFADVSRLEAGQTVHFKHGRPVESLEGSTSPDRSLTFEEAVDNLRQTLIEAVERRLDLGKTVTSDCSGGFDSSMIAILSAKRLASGLDAFIQYRVGTGFGDLPFARAIGQEISGLRLHEIHEDIEALPFHDFEGAVWGDEPGGAIFHGRLKQRFGAAMAYGSELHLLGEGGDAVLDWPQEALSDIANTGQTDYLRRLCMSYARSRNLNPADLYAAALSSAHRTLADDLQDLSASLYVSGHDNSIPPFNWINFPGKAKAFLGQSMRRQLSEAAERQATELRIPKNMQMGDYVSLKEVQGGGFSQRQTQLIAQSLGLEASAPYLDRNVIAACLQFPASKRAIPQEYKPVLRQAFRDIMPPVLYSRTTAGTYSNVMYKGFRKALPSIKRLFDDDSRLAALGIIDLPAIRQQVEYVDMGLAIASANFDCVIEAEIWLRGLKD